MKPSPYLLNMSMRAIGASPSKTLFVGDSISDIHAGAAVGVGIIGYANKPGKVGLLQTVGAVSIPTHMRKLSDVLRLDH